MNFDTLLYAADLFGTSVFAITGAIAARGKRLDIFGVVVLALVTAVGGGTIRDVTLDLYPVSWVNNPMYLWVAIVSAVAAFILCRYLAYPRRLMLVLDAIGLAVFAAIGAEKALANDLPPVIVVMMAVITGCAGGMIRDVLTGQIPLILQRDGEIYATCAIAGAAFYVAFANVLDERLLLCGCMLIVFVVRLAALFANLRLPEFVMAGHPLESPGRARDTEDKL